MNVILAVVCREAEVQRDAGPGVAPCTFLARKLLKDQCESVIMVNASSLTLSHHLLTVRQRSYDLNRKALTLSCFLEIAPGHSDPRPQHECVRAELSAAGWEIE